MKSKRIKKKIKKIKRKTRTQKGGGAYVINLSERTDRWNIFQESFKDAGINIKRVDAIKNDTGWIGCALSHIKAIKAAKEEGLPCVLIMEDDVLPIPEFKIYWPKIRKWLDNHKDQWDYFSGGNSYYSFNHNNSKDTVKPVCKIEDISIYKSPVLSFQCYYLNSSVYDTFINMESSIGKSAWNPIDFWPNNKKMKTLCCTPFLVKHGVTYSNIEKQVRNYNAIMNLSEDIIESIPNNIQCDIN